MSQWKNILQRLSRYYGGEYTEIVEDENSPDMKFEITILTPRTVFKHRYIVGRNESLKDLQERTREHLVWLILQKGVEFVNEQSDIFHLFNPDKHL